MVQLVSRNGVFFYFIHSILSVVWSVSARMRGSYLLTSKFIYYLTKMKDKEQAINGVKSEQIFLQEKQNPEFISFNKYVICQKNRSAFCELNFKEDSIWLFQLLQGRMLLFFFFHMKYHSVLQRERHPSG